MPARHYSSPSRVIACWSRPDNREFSHVKSRLLQSLDGTSASGMRFVNRHDNIFAASSCLFFCSWFIGMTPVARGLAVCYGVLPHKRSARNFPRRPATGSVTGERSQRIESFSPVLADLPRRNWMKADQPSTFNRPSTTDDTELNNQGTKTRII